MWQTAILTGAFDHVKKIVVLDDGGRNIQAVPPALLDSKLIVGVEQTMNGITLNRSKLPLIPFIAVGSSAAKLLIEPPIIRDSCLRSVAERVPLQSGTAGVVGLGNIGRAVSEGLQAVGVEVFTYDRRSDRTTHSSGRACATLTSLYQSSDTIWGCTGADHLSGHPWKQYIENVKDLISCSSTDSEFRTTLDSLNERADLINSDRLSDIVLSNPPFTSILYGGFPINFTGTTEVEALRDIQFTRALLFLGVLQALKIRAKIGGGEIPLSPNGQFEVVRCWLAMYPERRSWYKNQLLEVFKSIDGIASYERSSR